MIERKFKFPRRFRLDYPALFDVQAGLLNSWVPPAGWAKSNEPFVIKTVDEPVAVRPSFVCGPFAIYGYTEALSKRSGLFLRLGHRPTGSRIVLGHDPDALARFAAEHCPPELFHKIIEIDDAKRVVSGAQRAALMKARYDFHASQFASVDTLGRA
jgi:hypothetical protein